MVEHFTCLSWLSLKELEKMYNFCSFWFLEVVRVKCPSQRMTRQLMAYCIFWPTTLSIWNDFSPNKNLKAYNHYHFEAHKNSISLAYLSLWDNETIKNFDLWKNVGPFRYKPFFSQLTGRFYRNQSNYNRGLIFSDFLSIEQKTRKNWNFASIISII